MAVPVVTKPATQKTPKGAAITPLKVKATEMPLTTTKWKVEKGLPTGLVATEVGEELEFTGTPTARQSFTVGLVAHNATGNSAESTFTWEVGASAEESSKEAITNPQTVKLTANTVATVELGVATDLVTVIAHKSLKSDAYFTVDSSVPILLFGYFVGAEGVIHSSETVARANANNIVVKIISAEEGQITVVGHEGIL